MLDGTASGRGSDRGTGRDGGRDVPGRVFITQPIPGPGPDLVPRGRPGRWSPTPRTGCSRPPSCADGSPAARGFSACSPTGSTPRCWRRRRRAAAGSWPTWPSAITTSTSPPRPAWGSSSRTRPGVLTEATADLTWTLILAAARRVVEGDEEMRAGRFPGWGPIYLLGGDVSGRTLGLIGPGRIAVAVAERAAGSGCPSLPRPPREPGARRPGRAAGRPRRAAREPATSSACTSRSSAETHHLIDARALARMKPTAYLINTARGPVVDEHAAGRGAPRRADRRGRA